DRARPGRVGVHASEHAEGAGRARVRLALHAGGRAHGRLVQADHARPERGRAVHAVARALVPAPDAEAEAAGAVVLALHRGRARAGARRRDPPEYAHCVRPGRARVTLDAGVGGDGAEVHAEDAAASRPVHADGAALDAGVAPDAIRAGRRARSVDP